MNELPKNAFLSFSVPMLLFLLVVLGPGQTITEAKSSDKTVIKVGNEKIQKSSIDTLLEVIAKRKYGTTELRPEEEKVLKVLVAENLINQELLQQEANRLKIKATSHEIDSVYDLFKKNFNTQDAFRQALLQAGDDEKGLREKLIKLIRVDKLLKGKLPEPTPPTEQEMLEYYNKNKRYFPVNDSLRASQILLKGSSPRNQEKLETIRKEFQSNPQLGNKILLFSQKAAQISDAPEAQKGGDLGRFHPDDFFPDFKQAVMDLKVGEISKVFKSPLGWHLVILTEKFDGKFENYRLQLSQLLLSQKARNNQTALRKYLENLGKRFPVTYLDQSYQNKALAGN